jgi:hypothetical protein
MPKQLNQLRIGDRIVNRLPIRKEKLFEIKGADQRLLADIAVGEYWDIVEVNSQSHPLWVKLAVPYSHGTRTIIFSGGEYSGLFN